MSNKIHQITYKSRTEFRVNGKLHREDGPAVIWNDGTENWYQNGRLHREDGPARTWYDGSTTWYIDGVPQSEPGPQIVKDIHEYIHAHGLHELIQSGDEVSMETVRGAFPTVFAKS